MPDTEFYDDEIRVESGDTLVLVTDGLVEIHTAHGVSGRSEFEDRLAAKTRVQRVLEMGGHPLPTFLRADGSVTAAAGIVERLAAATNVNDDDVAILALQARGNIAGRPIEVLCAGEERLVDPVQRLSGRIAVHRRAAHAAAGQVAATRRQGPFAAHVADDDTPGGAGDGNKS